MKRRLPFLLGLAMIGAPAAELALAQPAPDDAGAPDPAPAPDSPPPAPAPAPDSPAPAPAPDSPAPAPDSPAPAPDSPAPAPDSPAPAPDSPAPEPKEPEASEDPTGVVVENEVPPPPYAQWTAHDPSAKRVSLDEAIELALAQHPRVAVAAHQTAVAEAQLGQAKSAYYPQVNVWLQALRSSANGSLTVYHNPPGLPRVGGSTPDGVDAGDSFNNFLAAATVHQLLYDFGRTQGAVGAQRALLEGAKMNQRLIEQSVIFEVTRAFYEVLRKREAVVVAEDGVRLTERVLELARSGERAGLRPPSESARAEADVATAELALIRARAELDVARVQFANAVGGTETPLEPAGELLAEEVALTEEEALALALQHRPELLAFDFRHEALRQRLRSAKAGHYPSFEALGGVSARGMFLNSNDQNFVRNNWNVGVVMHLPVFQGMRVVEQVKELEAEIRALRASEEVIHQAVVVEVKEALAQLRSADEAVRATSKGVKAAKVALDTIEGRYRTGLANIVEMTDAQTAYISAVSAALRASYNQILARANLQLAIGRLSATGE